MIRKTILVCGLSAGLMGCSSAPGNSKQQGAVIGGATGAAVGAAVTKNKALGAVIGGAVGAAGGYVVGGKTGSLDNRDGRGSSPSTSTGSATSKGISTADNNGDGFVTLDEIVDMEKKGYSDEEIIHRLEATGLTFDLGAEHRQYLSQRGVSQAVIDRLSQINRGSSTSGSAVIGR